MSAALEVEGLAVGRGGVPLLAGLSFRLDAGEALLLQGPNGSGKSTLLRTLAGLLPPIAGTVQGEEAALAGHLDGVKAQLTVEENLRFWARVHGQTDLGPALAQFGLAPLRQRAARSLSAGQKRRLGLARMLLSGRRLWLLDEPTVSLDAASVAAFGAMIGAHLAAGGAAVVATHVAAGFEARVLEVAQFAPANAAHTGGAPPSGRGADAFGADW